MFQPQFDTKTVISVNAEALRQVLVALYSVRTVEILELWATKNIPNNPIATLAKELTRFAEHQATIDNTPVMEVGQLVVPKEGAYLRSGAEQYARAVVVSMKPFVLVSVDADMRWESTVTPDEFLPVGRATPQTLAKCMTRRYTIKVGDIVIEKEGPVINNDISSVQKHLVLNLEHLITCKPDGSEATNWNGLMTADDFCRRDTAPAEVVSLFQTRYATLIEEGKANAAIRNKKAY